MRSFIAVLPFVAGALAQADTTVREDYTLVPEISGSVTITSTFRYSNPATLQLTETDSNGVVTGLPDATVATQPAVVTTQPAVDTVPAGLTSAPVVATIPAGIIGTTVFTRNGTAGVYSYTVIGSNTSTTVIAGPAGISTTVGSSSVAAGTTGRNGQTTGGRRPTTTRGSGSEASASGSASGTAASSTDNAATSNMHLASGGLIGLAALFAALL